VTEGRSLTIEGQRKLGVCDEVVARVREQEDVSPAPSSSATISKSGNREPVADGVDGSIPKPYE
jgi:hypothetical protein